MADVLNLTTLGDELLTRAQGSTAQRAAQAVFAAPTLRAMLVALAEGGTLAEHNAPPAATLQCLRGRARLHAGEQEWLLAEGEYAAVPPQRHGVDALTDCVLLLTVAANAAPAPVEQAAAGH
jgi:quercetin dioxygenase-like cupin family protein